VRKRCFSIFPLVRGAGFATVLANLASRRNVISGPSLVKRRTKAIKLSGFSRDALGICAAIALLAGCGGSQPLISAPGTMPHQSVIRADAISRHIDGNTLSSYRVLYNFGDGSDGQHPYSSLVDVNGTLYGTTFWGGKYHEGTVFSISTTGTEHVLHSFGHGQDGQEPDASLIDVNGTLYGTTTDGGKFGSGTLFSISMTGTERVLHSFSNLDGSFPNASLIDVKGMLYGTTTQGGSHTYGMVFSASTTGTVHVLHSFGGFNDGMFPGASLIDVNGTLYGSTSEGGKYHSNGTVFSISTSGAEHVLHSFGHEPDGEKPQASLIDVNGTLYGTTASGGGHSVKVGTVFSISTTGTEHMLYSFRYPSDGENPTASLIDVNGTLYGTTYQGGKDGNSSWDGTVFSVTTSGAEHVLHDFGNFPDGAAPMASLIDVKGTLYGTTSTGGTHNEGTIFTLKP
jgi:uncharacterized repeat protein (TIGR03803 family)